MDDLKGYNFIATKVRPSIPKVSSAPGLNVTGTSAAVRLAEFDRLRRLESAESYTHVPFRRCISVLSLLEVALGFVMTILQIDSNGKPGFQMYEITFVRAVEFGLFGSLSTILAGSFGFVVSREHMKIRSRYHLFLCTLVITSWCVLNDTLMMFIHFGLASYWKERTGDLALGGSHNTTTLTGEKLAARYETTALIYRMKVALLVLFFIAAVVLGITTIAVAYNLVVGLPKYLAPRMPHEKPEKRRKASVDSTLENVLRGTESWRNSASTQGRDDLNSEDSLGSINSNV